MAKDRAAPFSRKHRRTWLTVTGGMILIGAVNLSIGMYYYSRRPRDAPRVPGEYKNPFVDAGVDAAPSPANVER